VYTFILHKKREREREEDRDKQRGKEEKVQKGETNGNKSCRRKRQV